MPIRVKCNCGHRMSAPEKFAGKRVRCKACGNPVRIGQLKATKPETQQDFWESDDYEDYEQIPPRHQRRSRARKRQRPKKKRASLAFGLPIWAVAPLAIIGALILVSAVIRNVSRVLATSNSNQTVKPFNLFPASNRHPDHIAAENAMSSTTSFSFNFDTVDLDGNRLSLQAYRGKPVVVYLSTTWCPTCKRQDGAITALALTARHDFQLVGLICEPDADPSEIRRVVRRNLADYPCAIADDRLMQQIPDFTSVPTTLVLDSQGNVRLRQTGYCSTVFLNHVLEQI